MIRNGVGEDESVSGETRDNGNWGSVLRSDLLPLLVKLLEALPGWNSLLPQILQIRVVIDANIVQGELRWRLKTRKQATSRTALHEVMACGVLVAYAPHFLDAEIREHANRIAAETKTTPTDVHREWSEFRRLIHFYTPRVTASADMRPDDPDDVAYVDMFQDLALQALYTRDKDFLKTPVPLLLVTIDMTLRQYARANAIRMGIGLGAIMSTSLTFQILIALKQLLATTLKAARRIPPAAQAIILVSLAALIAHPKSRSRLLTFWASVKQAVQPPLVTALIKALCQFAEATSTANDTLKTLELLLPPRRRQPILFHARSVCLAAGKPLAIDEIVRGVVANGYKPRSERPHAYLRRVLRNDNRFLQTETGAWVVRDRA